MKPRTLAILAVVLAVIGVSGFVATRVMGSRVDDAFRRFDAEREARGSLADLDETAKAERVTELNDIKITIDRSKIVGEIGSVAWMLAMLTFAYRTRVVQRLRVAASAPSANPPDAAPTPYT